MHKYYTNLIISDFIPEDGYYCKGKGWHIHFMQNPSCNIIVNNEPAKEIVIYSQSEDRAKYVANLVLAAYCLYTGELLINEDRTVFSKRAETTSEIYDQMLNDGHYCISAYNLPISCLIAAKASQKYVHQYAIFKYVISCCSVSLSSHSLDPQTDWTPSKAILISAKDHVLYANAITQAYSVLEELSLELRASNKEPSMINGEWNPKVKNNLQKRLTAADIDLSEHLLWHQRGTPTNIERERKPNVIDKTEWARYEVRDAYIDIIDAISYASWLRSKVSAHRLSRLSRSLTEYDVANVQHLSRRLLLETLGFWRKYH